MNGYILNKKLIEEVPNKYNLYPKDIRKFKVLNWDKLKEKTWLNNAMNNGPWYCHLEGSQGKNEKYNDEDEFWIGFNESTGEVKYHFSSYEGMCHYNFTSFYSSRSIQNKYDMNVQVNTLRFLNMLLDEHIISKDNKI